MSLKESPLIEEHRRLSARFTSFYGWKLPLEYSSAKQEHLCVRNSAGLFDVSHMGEIRIKGKNSLSLLERILSNEVAQLKKHQAQYSLLCNADGGIIDDLILYCLEFQQDYLLCVNAGRTDFDFEWIQKNNTFTELDIQNESHKFAQLALQGPKAFKILSDLILEYAVQDLSKNMRQNFKVNLCHFPPVQSENFCPPEELLNMKRFHFKILPFMGELILISRTGYTGEKGFEILCSPGQGVVLWRKILEKGQKAGISPAGLAARDTLRIEMKYPLYGKDLNENTDPYSAGLGWAVKNTKDFIGSSVLQRMNRQVQKKWIGFQLLKPGGIPRENYAVFSENKKVLGRVTGGALSPCLKSVIGMAYVDKEFANIGQLIYVQIHGNLVPAKIVKTPFILKLK